MTTRLSPDDPERARRNLMRAVRLIIVNWIAGAILGVAFAGLALWSDVAGLGRLVLNAQPMWPPLLLLAGGFAVTFASLVAGTAIMLIPREEDPPDDPPGGKPVLVLTPVRASVRAKAR